MTIRKLTRQELIRDRARLEQFIADKQAEANLEAYRQSIKEGKLIDRGWDYWP